MNYFQFIHFIPPDQLIILMVRSAEAPRNTLFILECILINFTVFHDYAQSLFTDT